MFNQDKILNLLVNYNNNQLDSMFNQDKLLVKILNLEVSYNKNQLVNMFNNNKANNQTNNKDNQTNNLVANNHKKQAKYLPL